MKPFYALFALTLAASVGACNPSPEMDSLDADTPQDMAFHSPAIATAEPDEGDTLNAADTLSLSPFKPATVEIYCSFHRPAQNGELGDLIFMTEIAGVPAPAAIGLEGQPVRLEEVSKSAKEGAGVWTYHNAQRPVEVQLTLTETAEGSEYRSYEGTIRITDPALGDIIPIEGTCGV
ncbi:MAG: hypothetical protein CVT79_12045 [Alphaproteobacteria bacterium HGW-Alphaproteobacteria-18]|nr:MAG: hypothetical protein CVT79_12045 [Alphaproteobacteria bacterium HGW-Alphaproteobacteria-18]